MGSGQSGSGGAGSGQSGAGVGTGRCVDAQRLWSEDFESGNYSAWSGQSYGADWGDGCQSTARSTETSVSPSTAQRSEITCVYRAEAVHRGYGGLQFDGDRALPQFTNRGMGTDAPNGLVNTIWVRVDSDTVFENGNWMSLWSVNASCDWGDPTDEVLTLGLEDPSGRVAAAHYQSGGGSRTFEPNAPGLPRRTWVRLTIYLNYHTGVMHVWQDGVSHQHVTFSRPLRTICHWHWGLYASANNDAIVLFEDDNSIWKLNEPWEDFSVEPYLGEDIAVCD